MPASAADFRSHLDLAQLLQHFPELLVLLQNNGTAPIAEAARQLSLQGPAAWIAFLTEYWTASGSSACRHAQDLQPSEVQIPASEALTEFILQVFLQPYAEFLAAHRAAPPAIATHSCLPAVRLCAAARRPPHRRRRRQAPPALLVLPPRMGIPPHPLPHLWRRSRKQAPRLRRRTIPPHPRRSLRHLPLLHPHHRPDQRRPRHPPDRRPSRPPPHPLGRRTQLFPPPSKPPRHLICSKGIRSVYRICIPPVSPSLADPHHVIASQ